MKKFYPVNNFSLLKPMDTVLSRKGCIQYWTHRIAADAMEAGRL